MQCLQNPADEICVEVTLHLAIMMSDERDVIRWKGRYRCHLFPEAIIAEGFGDQRDGEYVGAEEHSGSRVVLECDTMVWY